MWTCSFRRIVCCAVVLVVCTAAQEHHPEHSWDYGDALGPAHWGDLKPEFSPCKTGHRQSPIDIRNPQKADLPLIRFDYKSSPLHIIDNGHTIMVNYAPGSSMSVGGKKYALKQFHFHRPSEEKVNGSGFEMSVHLVHADGDGKLAVVAVLLQEGEDNPLVRELWSDLPKEKEKEELLDNIQIDVSRILPSDRNYYTFSGSPRRAKTDLNARKENQGELLTGISGDPQKLLESKLANLVAKLAELEERG
jgi:carbonic anhydrase